MVPKCPKCGSFVSLETDVKFTSYDKGDAMGRCDNADCKAKVYVNYALTISGYDAAA